MTTKRPNSSHQLLAKLLSRWEQRRVRNLAVAVFKLHEVSIAHEQRLRKRFRCVGLQLVVVRQTGDVIMSIVDDRLQQIEIDQLPWEILRFKRRPTGYEQVTPEIVPMPYIPKDSNPFHYDAVSMGTYLPRDWAVMHEGFDNPKDPTGMEFLYLVNIRTGQRIGIKLHHVQ